MPEISRARALAYAAAALLLLTLGGRFFLASEPPETSGSPRAARPALRAEREQPRDVVVHVAGAVRRPGLYRLREGSRVDDAITRAGGARPRAALDLVNLAAPLADGQQVLVPMRGEATGAAPAAGDGADASAAGRVHLNSATLEQLDALPGIGPVTAQQILDYRAAKGAFSSVDELDAVPGIGPARLEQLKPLVDL